MQNFIEVVFFKDQAVIDGIIHGTYHRTKQEENISLEEVPNNLLFFVDVTQNAAQSSLYCTLRREPPFDIVPTGIYQTETLVRGSTLVRPTFIFSDNLDVIDKDKFSNALGRICHAIWTATNLRDTQIRFIVSEALSEKFTFCLNQAMYQLNTDSVFFQRNKRYHPNEDDLEQNITLKEFVDCFMESNVLSGRLQELDKIVLGEDLCKLISDEMLTRVIGNIRVNKKNLFIPANRFRKYVMRNCISLSGAIV